MPLSSDLVEGEQVMLEQLQKMRELVAQGRSEYAARVEVLAKGHQLDCECGVCS